MSGKPHVHFMGIGGSGMAPIAIIAMQQGYTVTGCDLSVDGYYSGALARNGIAIQRGHDDAHLAAADILAVSPAVFDLSPGHPELVEAERRGILMTWQEFAGKYLQAGKTVIAVSGTHGKSTTAILMGATLEYGGFDPTVEAGTIYKPWDGGYRIGQSEYFVCEADEFNNNFFNFSPSVIIVNNIEMDHPEFFKDFSQVKEAFKSFIMKLRHLKILVVNEESPGVRDVLLDLREFIHSNNIEVIGYYSSDSFGFEFRREYKGRLLSSSAGNTLFEASCPEWTDSFEIGVTGRHNVANALGVLAAAIALGMDKNAVKGAFRQFKGISRRSEFVGEVRSILFFDDYAHHPTAVDVMLESLRESFPGRTLWAVWEPHQISRLKLFYNEFACALNKADRVIVTKIFKGREALKQSESLDMNHFVDIIGSDKARYIEAFDLVAEYLELSAGPGDIVVVIGAGESYKLTKKIMEKISASPSA